MTMEKKFEPRCDKEDVLIHLQDSKGQRYTCAQLAKTFKVPTTTMRVLLTAIEGKVRQGVDGKNRKYWVPTDAEVAAANVERPVREFKAMTGYGAMLADAMGKRGF